MVRKGPWTVDPHTWHIAKDRDGWKVLREGSPTAYSRHETKADAIDAARAMATEERDSLIKIHKPDGKLDHILHPERW